MWYIATAVSIELPRAACCTERNRLIRTYREIQRRTNMRPRLLMMVNPVMPSSMNIGCMEAELAGV